MLGGDAHFNEIPVVTSARVLMWPWRPLTMAMPRDIQNWAENRVRVLSLELDLVAHACSRENKGWGSITTVELGLGFGFALGENFQRVLRG